MSVKRLFSGFCMTAGVFGLTAAPAVTSGLQATISLKTPGNKAVAHELSFTDRGDGLYVAPVSDEIPVSVSRKVTTDGTRQHVTVVISASDDVYFNYGEKVNTGFRHADNQYFMPGFWYRQNLRSPKNAPSFRESDSWLVREDRLSSPLTGVYNPDKGEYVTVARLDCLDKEALTTHKEGEVIVSGETSIGYTGFENDGGLTRLCYGFPYKEAPRTYIRKLTLAPSVEAYQKLGKGEKITLNWELVKTGADDYADCVRKTWEYCYDTFRPVSVESPYTSDQVKEALSHFFTESYVDREPLKYFSGVELLTATCESTDIAEVGFLGRTLLNAFNALEYGEQNSRQEFVDMSAAIYDTYLENGFSPAGFFKEVLKADRGGDDGVRSIRRQSEGAYAMLNYLMYEKRHKRNHRQWDNKIKDLLDAMLTLQNEDGSFPRKFKDDHTMIDASGGSTPSATLPLVMGYKYFKDKRYLESARRTMEYLEHELISKADYFSSTLDANCEDKEASLYASTAAYYLALVTKGEERRHCADLARKAAYFALSWYYTWDVPFAKGQMLGDVGLKTRGWGNVSVENNHIDVFVFEFADVLRWLAKEYDEPRFSDFAGVISSSMSQLLPYGNHKCDIAKTGYYPEVIQHTNWDYGRNGKGYYNNIFAPGWTVASLWQLYTPGRAEQFLLGKK